MNAAFRLFRMLSLVVGVLALEMSVASSHAGPPQMAIPPNQFGPIAKPMMPGNKMSKASPTWKLAQPAGPSVLGQQPQLIPGLVDKLQLKPGFKPQPHPQPNPNPQPGGGNHPNNDWWRPLANPNNWKGLLGHPHHPNYHPQPGPWHEPHYEPMPMPVDPGWGAVPQPDAELPPNALGAPVELLNPEATRTVMRFRLGDAIHQLEPGERVELPAGGQYVIEFHRGGSFGVAKYGMTEGLHWFKRTEQGWELYRGPYEEAAPTAPSEQLPENAW